MSSKGTNRRSSARGVAKKDITPPAATSPSSSSTITTGGGGPMKKTTARGRRHNPLSTASTSTASAASPSDPSLFAPNKKELLENFRCSICLDMFFEPVSLSCGHNFCKLCSLGRLIRNCPLCKTEVNNVVGLKVNSTLKALIRQFFGEEYKQREERWLRESQVWTSDVLTALRGASGKEGRAMTEPDLYEAFRVVFEKRGMATDLPTRQQFVYLLSHMKQAGSILVLRGKPFLFIDPTVLQTREGATTAITPSSSSSVSSSSSSSAFCQVLQELKSRKDSLPSYTVSKRKWQANWCTVILQRLKGLGDEQSYLKAKETMESFFDDFEVLEDFSELTPASADPPTNPLHSSLPSANLISSLARTFYPPYDSSDDDSDSDDEDGFA